MPLRNFYATTNPAQVLDKVRESHHFLAEMKKHEASGEIDKFLYSLSAFLKSFRTIAYRLFGVIENQSGHGQMKTLERQLKASHE